MQKINTNIIIIGAGPAGITAAIQLTRYGCNPLLIEKDRVGGLLWNANLIENYPGFSNGITGPKLITCLNKHMKKVGVHVIKDDVINLDYEVSQEESYFDKNHRIRRKEQLEHNGYFIVETSSNCYSSIFAIVASGTKPKMTEIKVSPEANERIYSSVLPIKNMRNKLIAVIGSGDAAFDYSLNLARKNKVIILNRSNVSHCLSELRTRAVKNPSINVKNNIIANTVEFDQEVKKLKIGCMSDNEMENIFTDYLICAIGREPQLDFYSDRIKRFQKILIGKRRLFVVGDVVNGLLRQAVIAAGDGMRAAMEIIYKLEVDR